MATYNITEVLNDVPGKFTCLVSFNGCEPERYEVEDPSGEVPTAEFVESVLTKVASEQETVEAEEAEAESAIESIVVTAGKIVV